MGLKQGNRTVADYSSLSSWNSAALVDAFFYGLAEYIKDELVSHEVPSTLDGVIELAIQIDLRVHADNEKDVRGLPSRQHSSEGAPPVHFLHQVSRW